MPPKSQKKKKPSAFSMFMFDYRRKEESKGVVFATNKDMTNAAGIAWLAASEDVKKHYAKLASESKAQIRNVKYTSLGEPIDRVLHRNQEKERLQRRMEEHTDELVFQNVNKDDFVNKTFYIGYVNFYCEVISQDRYYPSEIAIVRFNLRNGVDSNDAFHVIFNSGEVREGVVYQKLPMGYRLAAEKQAAETHQIPPPPHKPELGSVTDIKRSFSQLIDFLRQDLDPDQPLPPIFVETENLLPTTNVFQWMLYEFGYSEQMIKIYNLQYLFFSLRNASHMLASGRNIFFNKSLANLEMTKDVYDYIKGISCPYHATSDAYPHCSLSKAIRQVYIICDFCCLDIGIDLIPGAHVPMNAEPKQLESCVQSRAVSHAEPVSPRAESVSSRAESVYSYAESVETIESEMAQSTISDTSATTRRPNIESRLCDVPDFVNDFPTLGSRGRANRGGHRVGRNTPVGRGRGRIIDKTNN